MNVEKMNDVLKLLEQHLVINIDDYIPFPKPYIGKGDIKAIVIGADPSTNNSLRFDTVFDLNGEDNRYFSGIKRNLQAIGLSLDNIFVQNFCQNYFTKTSYDQKANWRRASGVWYQFIRDELDERYDRSIPLLITSELIMKRYIDQDIIEKNTYYYDNPEIVPIESNEIISGRKVFPFYRHWKYNLTRSEWKEYRKRLHEYFE